MRVLCKVVLHATAPFSFSKPIAAQRDSAPLEMSRLKFCPRRQNRGILCDPMLRMVAGFC